MKYDLHVQYMYLYPASRSNFQHSRPLTFHLFPFSVSPRETTDRKIKEKKEERWELLALLAG